MSHLPTSKNKPPMTIIALILLIGLSALVMIDLNVSEPLFAVIFTISILGVVLRSSIGWSFAIIGSSIQALLILRDWGFSIWKTEIIWLFVISIIVIIVSLLEDRERRKFNDEIPWSIK